MLLKKNKEKSAARKMMEDALNEESRVRQFTGPFKTVLDIWLALIPFLGIVFILGLHTRLGITIYLEQWIGAYLAMFMSCVYIFKPATKKGSKTKLPWYDAVLAILSLVAGFWITVRYPAISNFLGYADTERMIFGALAVILLVEAIRRTLGMAIFVILLVFLIYGKWSSYFPGVLAGVPTTWERYMNYLYLDSGSLMYMLRLACNIGLGFIFFSQVLMCFKGADGLTDFAFIGFGRTRGGPAKASVVGSSLVGTISGAPMANVYLTGSVTIPLMMRTGWKAEKAGAVEAVASSGGTIMPPVMGIAAFLIAERLNMQYSQVALAALIPAALYYLGAFIQVDLYAGRYGLHGLKKEEIPNGKETFKKYWMLIPIFGILIYLLFFNGMSAQGSAVISALVGIPLMALRADNRKGFFKKLFEVFRGGGMTSMDIGCSMAAGGIVVGVVSFSGLGYTFGYLLNSLAHYGIFLLLLGTAMCAIVLGMGMPAVAAYALTSALLASSLTKFGITELAANMFIFYFSVISNITPPIAMAVFAAVTLSKANFWKTGLESCKLAITIYIVPFLFVFDQSLLAQGSLHMILITVCTAVVGTFFMCLGLTGYWFRNIPMWKRVAFFGLGVLAMIPAANTISAVLNVVGICAGVVLLLTEMRYRKQAPQVTPEM